MCAQWNNNSEKSKKIDKIVTAFSIDSSSRALKFFSFHFSLVTIFYSTISIAHSALRSIRVTRDKFEMKFQARLN